MIREPHSRIMRARGIPVDVQLEVGLKKAIEWMSQRRQDDPSVRLAALVDEACRRYDLNPIQADFLYRHFTQG
jgi:hypothetical protein